MEKDWAARFDDRGNSPRLTRAWYAAILLLAILMFVASLGWAFIAISAGLNDSYGASRVLNFGGYVRGYVVAFAPMGIPILLGYWAWRAGRKRA